jgi:sulfinoalanine decarboxylase
VLLDPAPSPGGLGAQALLADLQSAMEGAYQPHHPGALAHLDPPPLTASVAADLICAGLNNNLLAEELAPSLTHLERGLCRWIAGRLGLPPEAGGVAASGGSLSNLMALVTARHAAGLATDGRAVVLASEDAHVSLAKALSVMGLPASALVRLPTDTRGRMRPADLPAALDALRHRDRPVIAVVGTAGTTVRGAVDPLGPIADCCRAHGIWFHVDGAIGSVFALSDHHAERVAGIGAADSVTVNPQKLLAISKTSSLLLLARPDLLRRAFATGLPYMEPSWGGGHGGEIGLQGSRPAEILKLWLGLRQLGESGIDALLDGAIRRCRQLEAALDRDRFTFADGPLHLLALTPRGADPRQAEEWSQRTRRTLLERHLMLSRPRYRGRSWLKAVLGNPHTGPEWIQTLADHLNASLDREAVPGTEAQRP